MKSTKLENFQFPGDWKALRKYCEYLEKQVADDKLAIAGLQGNIAGSKLRQRIYTQK